MKGIILTGGSGTRLAPLTKITNKSLLPVGGVPMIMYPLELLKASGVSDIMIITGTEHAGAIINLLGSGSELDCHLTYRVQDKANGIASAMLLAKSFVNGDSFTTVLGDNIFVPNSEIVSRLRTFQDSNDEYLFFSKSVHDPQRFGVAVYDGEGRVIDIIEKPPVPPSDQAIVGVYAYKNSDLVFRIIESLVPSARGEYEVSELNQLMVKRTSGTVCKIGCDWIDAGTHESYRKANELVWSKS